MHFIHLTDLHLANPENSESARNRAVFVQECLRKLAVSNPEAATCVITGDLADIGEPEVYLWFKKVLGALPLTVDLMVGNHDDRSAFLGIFAGSGQFYDGFAQGERDTPDAKLIFLDTHIPGSDAGRLCAMRLAWLREKLLSAGKKPVFLFMHHPPCEIGDPIMDPIMLENPRDLARVLDEHGNVRHIFFGHVHRERHLIWNGIPASCIGGITQAEGHRDLLLDVQIVEFIEDKVTCETLTISRTS